MEVMRDWMIKRANQMQYLLALVLLLLLLLFHHRANGAVRDSVRQVMVDSVYNEIVAQGIQHPEIVLQQSIWESGWYECTSCSRRYNNIFGFRHASWVSEDNLLGYIKFDTWQESVAYYKRWQDKWYTGGDYYAFLVEIGYAEDEEYINNLKSIKV